MIGIDAAVQLRKDARSSSPERFCHAQSAALPDSRRHHPAHGRIPRRMAAAFRPRVSESDVRQCLRIVVNENDGRVRRKTRAHEAGTAADGRMSSTSSPDAQAGDTAAFNELVTRYRSRAFSMIYNMVRNEQDAWDLAQDGFVKAWKSIGRFRGQSSFYTWLYRILMNVTHRLAAPKADRGRHGIRRRDRPSQHRARRGHHAAGGAASRPNTSRRQGNPRAHRRGHRELSPEHRAVIVMREIDGLEYSGNRRRRWSARSAP